MVTLPNLNFPNMLAVPTDDRLNYSDDTVTVSY
jgi:hypothetical protein